MAEEHRGEDLLEQRPAALDAGGVEESKSSAPTQAVPIVAFTGKPTFEQVISCQASSGNWTKENVKLLHACIAGSNYEDSAV